MPGLRGHYLEVRLAVIGRNRSWLQWRTITCNRAMSIRKHREEVGLDTVGNDFTSERCGSEMTTHVSKPVIEFQGVKRAVREFKSAI